MKGKSDKKAFLAASGILQDFLNSPRPNQEMKINFELSPSVKDLFEARGIPHTAVYKIEVNGVVKSFDYNVKESDRIKLFPYKTTEHIDDIFVRPSSFIADVHLGKLAKTLRLLGLDCIFNKDWDDERIIASSNNEQRMILTRDRELLKNGRTRYGYWIRSTNPDEQINELFERFDLLDKIDPFTRCMKCNGLLEQVPLEQIEEKVPPKVKQWHSEFWQCKECRQVYWQGSHFKDLQQKVNKLLQP